MLNKVLNKSVIYLLATLILTNCAKTGPQGEKGEAGKDGNANVRSSLSANLLWTYNTTTARYETLINNTAITQEILDRGTVMVAAETSVGNWLQMPFSIASGPNLSLYFNYEYFLNGVRLSIQNSNYDNSLSPVNTLRFKVTVMSGTARPGKEVNQSTAISEPAELAVLATE